MAGFSKTERSAHVLRRLSLGGHPSLVADLRSTDDAIAMALNLSTPTQAPHALPAPAGLEDARNPRQIIDPIAWWVEAAVQPERMIEDRLIWFWHDHFATSLRKVPIPYLLWNQHLAIRSHATGNFGELLSEMARDPAMLFYLDGVHNHREAINENYAREVMELHTLGPGHYTQNDVEEAARAFTGWAVRIPGTRADQLAGHIEPWHSALFGIRHDSGPKTILGTTADHDLQSTIDLLLDHPATARTVGTKLFETLVGMAPDAATSDRIAAAFAGYDIMTLVEAIVATPAFVSDDAIRTQVRTPFERMITVAQTYELARPMSAVVELLVDQQFIPFVPPNPAGYPTGTALLGPHSLIHGFDLAAMIDVGEVGTFDGSGVARLQRLGVWDVSDTTKRSIASAESPAMQLALSVNAPEMFLA